MNLPQTRAEALRLGFAHYFTGKPCKRGHVSERSAHGDCLECIRERDKSRKRDHVEHRAAQLASRLAKPDKYYGAEPSARVRAWRKSNPIAYKAIKHARRARMRGASGHFTANDIAVIRERQGDHCFYCGSNLGGVDHIDHYVPLAKGGTNWPENLRLSCRMCNFRKGGKLPEQFVQEMALKPRIRGMSDQGAVPCASTTNAQLVGKVLQACSR